MLNLFVVQNQYPNAQNEHYTEADFPASDPSLKGKLCNIKL